MKEKLPERAGEEEEEDRHKSFPASCLEESGEPASGREELGPQPIEDGGKEVKTLFSFSSIFGAAGGGGEERRQGGNCEAARFFPSPPWDGDPESPFPPNPSSRLISYSPSSLSRGLGMAGGGSREG